MLYIRIAESAFMKQQFRILFLFLGALLAGCQLEVEEISDIDGPADIPFSRDLQKQLGYTQEVISKLQACNVQYSDNTYEEQRAKNTCACRALKGHVPKVYAMYCQEGSVTRASNARGIKDPLTQDL
jgi:hypothetical protein